MKSQLRRHLYVLSPQVCLLYGEGDATTSFCCCQTSQTIFLVFSDSVAYFPDLSRLHLAFNLCGCYSYTHSKWFEKKNAILEFLNKIKIFSSLITWSNKRYYYLKFLFIPFFYFINSFVQLRTLPLRYITISTIRFIFFSWPY